MSASVVETTKLAELESEGYIVTPIKGVSMRPLLREDFSQVLICKSKHRPRKYDVVLYVRADGVQVLHRIIGFDGDVCLIRGDNTFAVERVPIKAVRGVMKVVWCGEREIRVGDTAYRIYARVWNWIYPLRFGANRIIAVLRRLKRVREAQ